MWQRAHEIELTGLRNPHSHLATLEGMKQSPLYETLTQVEWAFIERCLAFESIKRPTARDLFDNMYFMYGPG